jgi:hypothetical protein
MTDFGANKRSFNTLSIDRVRGLIKKTSTDEKKLVKELEWYLKLPKDVQYLSPRITQWSKDPGEVNITMELYGYRALNTLWLEQETLSPVWEKVFEALSTCISDMEQYKTHMSRGLLYSVAKDMYLYKTLDRLKQTDLSRFQQDRIIINDQELYGLSWIIRNLDTVLDQVGVYDFRTATLIHGDLCLSNILYDHENGFIRLIDPRGSFGILDNFGDKNYELAKLSHSIDGNYDLYINGQFFYEDDGNSIQMHALNTQPQYVLKARFQSWLHSKCTDCYKIKMIQSLLFLSMIPLHADRPRSQKAFCCQGILDFNQVIQDLGIQV